MCINISGCNEFSYWLGTKLNIKIWFVAIPEPQQVVSKVPGLFHDSDQAEKYVGTFDIVVCGGTLGIFIATALSSKGLRVGIVERTILKGVSHGVVGFGN